MSGVGIGGGTTASSAPPTVAAATSFGARNGRRVVFQGVQLTFDKDVDLTRALNVANYSLVEQQGRRRVTRRPTSVQFDSATNTVKVVTNIRQVRRGLTLVVEGNAPSGIVDRAGRLLDGNRDGNAGDDALFSIGRTNTRRLPIVSRL